MRPGRAPAPDTADCAEKAPKAVLIPDFAGPGEPRDRGEADGRLGCSRTLYNRA